MDARQMLQLFRFTQSFAAARRYFCARGRSSQSQGDIKGGSNFATWRNPLLTVGVHRAGPAEPTKSSWPFDHRQELQASEANHRVTTFDFRQGVSLRLQIPDES
jgi:hypothetical protein